MTYTVPCFVHVEDVLEREKLIEWLKGIGYTHFPFLYPSPFIATDSRGMIWMTDANRGGAYDAGTSIELFKALAAMNNENDREQWFVEEGRMFKCNSQKLNNYSYHALYTRKATVEEIVAYFRKQEI